MMKKNAFEKILISFLILLIFTACSDKKSAQSDKLKTSSVSKTISAAQSISENKKNAQNASAAKSEAAAQTENKAANVDVDLTQMSSTMIYSYVFDMLIDSDSYKDKIIKVKGNFCVYNDENDGSLYFAILIPDATACCQQGIEFVWNGNHTYPDDYPEINQEITITGQYKVTENNEGITYTYLEVSNLIF